MIKLRIEENVYEIKNSWEEITFGDFIHFMAISQDNFSEIDKFCEIIAAFSIKAKAKQLKTDLMNLDVADFVTLKEQFNWINDDINKLEKKNVDNFFEIDGKKYTIKKNYNKLTVGESLSFESLLKDKTIDVVPMELAFAVLFREVGADGKEKEFNEDDFLFILKNMKEKVLALDVLQTINFFLLGEKTSTQKNLLDSSIPVQKTRMSIEVCQTKKLKPTKKKKNTIQ